MKKGRLVATVSGAVLVVLLIISLLVWPVNTVYAQEPGNGTLIDCDPVSGHSQPITFSWSPFKETTKYRFVLAKDAAMTQVVVEAEVATTTYEYPGMQLDCGANYFWRVMALEPAPSDWSATFSFMIKSTSMPMPTQDYYGVRLLSPNNGAIGCPVKPASFSWSPFKETTKYKFLLAQDAAMTQIVAEVEVPTTAYEYNGTLEYSTNYFWRVMAIEPAPSDWSTTFSFTTEAATMPQPVRLLAPSNGILGIMVKPEPIFRWSPWRNTTKYDFVLAKDASMTSIVHEAQVDSADYPLPPGILSYSTNYFWRVRALEPSPSDWSATFSFMTEAAPPPAPSPASQLLSPSNGALNIPVKQVSFSWSPSGETTKYKFVLARDAAMTQVVKEAELTTIAYSYDGTLDYSTNYFWHVKALEPVPSDWSATFSFMTEAAPPPPSVPPPLPVSPSPTPPIKGMSCTNATAGQQTTAQDVSPFLLGIILLGLVFARRQDRDK